MAKKKTFMFLFFSLFFVALGFPLTIDNVTIPNALVSNPHDIPWPWAEDPWGWNRWVHKKSLTFLIFHLGDLESYHPYHMNESMASLLSVPTPSSYGFSDVEQKARNTLHLKEICDSSWILNENVPPDAVPRLDGVNRMVSYIESLRDEDAENFYNRYREEISFLGGEPVYCERKETHGNETETIRWLCRIEMPSVDVVASILNSVILGSVSPSLGLYVLYDEVLSYYGTSFNACYNDFAQSWIEAADSAHRLIRKDMNRINMNYSRLLDIYSEMEYSGVCYENYTGIGRQLCSEVKSVLKDTAQGRGMFALSKVIFYNFVSNISQREEPPDFSSVPLLHKKMFEIWSYVNSTEESWNFTVERVVNESEKRVSRALSLIEETQPLFHRAEREKLYMIDFSVFFLGEDSNTTVVDFGSVSHLYNVSVKKRENALALAENVTDILTSEIKQRGYLRDAWELSKKAEKEAQEMKSYISLALQRAEDSVNFLRSRVVEKMSEAEAMGVNVTLAREYFNEGESSNTLGDKFFYYSEALSALNDAMLSFTPPMDIEGNESIQRYLSKIQDLLDRAEQDGLDVSYERSMLDFILNNPDESIISRLVEIENSVLEKAMNAFSDLPVKREEIYSFISRAKGYFDYLLPEIESAEAGIVFNGIIDYEKGLGRLSHLREVYDNVLREIYSRMEESMPLSVEVDLDLPPSVEVGEEVYVHGYIYVYNDNPFTSKQKTVEIDFPFDLDDGDISGVEGVAYSDSMLTLRIPQLGPFESLVAEISTVKVFADLTITSTLSEGRDGNAYIIEEGLLDLNVPYVISFSDYDTVYIDGRAYGSVANLKSFEPGTYSFTSNRVVEGAYSVRKENISTEEVGSKVHVSYTMEISTEIPLDKVYVPLSKDERSANITGWDHDIVGGNLIVYNVDGIATLHVSYVTEGNILEEEINEDMEEISQELDDVEDSFPQDVVDEIRNELQEANQSLQQGDYEDAMNRIEEIKKKLKEHKDRIERLNDSLEKVKHDLLLINSYLSKAKELGLDTENVEEMSSRKEFIERGMNKTGEELESFLSSYDFNWLPKKVRQILREDKSKVGKIKADYLRKGYSDALIESLFENFSKTYARASTLWMENLSYVAEVEYLSFSIKNRFNTIDGSKQERDAELKEDYQMKKRELSEAISEYEALYDEAKRLGLEDLFPYTPKYLREKLKYLPSNSERALTYSINEMDKWKKRVMDVIKALRAEAEEKANEVKRIYESVKHKLPENVRQIAEKQLSMINEALQKGDYLKALKYAEELMSLLSRQKVKQFFPNLPLPLIGVGLFVILAGGGYYAYQKGLLRFGSEKKEKKLRRLSRYEEV